MKVAAMLIALFTSSIVLAKLPENYKQLSAREKQEVLWTQIEETSYSNATLPFFSVSMITKAFKDLFGRAFGYTTTFFSPDYLKTTFNHASDEMPEGRTKIIHAHGSTAKVRWVIKRNPGNRYTGLFKRGTEAVGLIRLSKALPRFTPELPWLLRNPVVYPMLLSASNIPGMGLKILLEGEQSVNLVAMNKLESQKEPGFFALPFTNVLPIPNVSGVSQTFQRYLKEAFDQAIQGLKDDNNSLDDDQLQSTSLPLTNFAAFNDDGSEVSNPVAPYQIVFYPSGAAKQSDEEGSDDFRKNVGSIPDGSFLYTMFVRSHPGANLEPIGDLFLDGEFKASQYGDEVLFFQHSARSN